MLGTKALKLMSIALLGTWFLSTASVAQSLGTTDAPSSKQARKADRKARKAKAGAELKALEKNGYRPGDDQTNYPQNLQNAERKVDAQKAGASKASSTP